jgi:hypothetical protein
VSNGPPSAKTPVTGSAQIRGHEIAALKFRADYVDVLENNRRIEVITQTEARRRLALGGYEPVGNNTVKYLRRVPRLPGPIDGPNRKTPPRAADNFTTVGKSNARQEQRFFATKHPWARAPVAGSQPAEYVVEQVEPNQATYEHKS